MTSLILASSSQYRRAQLNHLGIKVIAIAANIDESAHPQETPRDLALRLAQQKAQHVGKQHPSEWVIGCDQVATVMVEGKAHILGKPGSVANAVSQLKLCCGREVVFYSAVALYCHQQQRWVADVDETRVKFRHLSAAEISAYVHSETPLDCAGSFKVEGKGILLFEQIKSVDPTGLVGLPLILLRRLYADVGIDLLALSTRL